MANTATVRSGGLTIDLADFHSLARGFRRVEPELFAGLKLRLRGIGQLVADSAKEHASFSETIPPSIKVRMSTLSVSVVATKAPLSGLEEMGKKGNRGSGVAWRHPVFGNKDVWVTQIGHPFLLPALKDKAEVIEALVDEAVGEAFDVALEV